jgi:hypothetical protein
MVLICTAPERGCALSDRRIARAVRDEQKTNIFAVERDDERGTNRARRHTGVAFTRLGFSPKRLNPSDLLDQGASDLFGVPVSARYQTHIRRTKIERFGDASIQAQMKLVNLEQPFF